MVLVTRGCTLQQVSNRLLPVLMMSSFLKVVEDRRQIMQRNFVELLILPMTGEWEHSRNSCRADQIATRWQLYHPRVQRFGNIQRFDHLEESICFLQADADQPIKKTDWRLVWGSEH